jgi:elongation factor G
VFCGSAFKNKGVQPLLTLLSTSCRPARRACHQGHRSEDRRRDNIASCSDDEPLSMLAFKIMNDPFVGSLTFAASIPARSKGSTVHELGQGKARARRPHAADALQQPRRHQGSLAGDIVALAGLKETTTGDTLCDPLKPVVLERMEFPEPVIEIAVEPKTKGDQEKMGLALQPLAAEDPSFRVEDRRESGQTIIAGMGELHLDILVDRHAREFKVEANVGAPQVAYRETITKPTKPTTPTRSSRVVRVSSPASRSSSSRTTRPGFRVRIKIVGGSVPKEYIPGVEKGIDR